MTAALVALAAALSSAQATAEFVWRGAPCGGAYEVRVADVPGEAIGSATWTPLPFGGRTDCVVTVEPFVFRHPTRLCRVVLHETGHLVGLEHSPNPRSIMHERLPRTHRRCPR